MQHVAIGLALEDGEAIRRTVEVLPRKQLNDESRHNHERRSDQKGALESPGIGHEPAEQRPYGVANKDGRLQYPQAEGHPLPGSGGGHQCHGGAQGTRGEPVQKPEDYQMVDIGGKGGEAQEDGATQDGPHHVPLAPVPVSRQAPDGAGEDHGDAHGRLNDTGPERGLASV